MQLCMYVCMHTCMHACMHAMHGTYACMHPCLWCNIMWCDMTWCDIICIHHGKRHVMRCRLRRNHVVRCGKWTCVWMYVIKCDMYANNVRDVATHVHIVISMYACIHTCMHAYLYIYIYICAVHVWHACAHACIHTLYIYVSCMHTHIYIYIYIYVYKHACTHASAYVIINLCVYACMYVIVHVCMHVCVHTCMHACKYRCPHLCTYASMRLCIYVYESMHLCIHASMYLSILFLILSFSCSESRGSPGAYIGFYIFIRTISINMRIYLCAATQGTIAYGTSSGMWERQRIRKRNTQARVWFYLPGSKGWYGPDRDRPSGVAAPVLISAWAK